MDTFANVFTHLSNEQESITELPVPRKVAIQSVRDPSEEMDKLIQRMRELETTCHVQRMQLAQVMQKKEPKKNPKVVMMMKCLEAILEYQLENQ